MPIVEVKPVTEIVDIPLKDLHIQYIPAVRPEQWWYGYDMMALKTSPHVDILKVWLAYGTDWELLFKHPYVQERQARKTVHGREDWTNKRIKKHLKRFFALYRSLEEEGYKKKVGNRKPVWVLDKPLWNTRFGYNTGAIGPEIYNGAHRCSCAYVLGMKTLPGQWCVDKAPGTNQIKKFEGKINGLYNYTNV